MRAPKARFSLRASIQYQIDNFMARGGLAVFLSLIFMFAMMYGVMLIVRHTAAYLLPPETVKAFSDHMWMVLIQMIDPGALESDADANFMQKISGGVTISIGLIFFSSLVAFMTTAFEDRLKVLRKGKSDVLEQGHTVILGFNNRILEIVEELILANENRKGLAVVILAEQDKEEMDEFFRENISDTRTTRVVTRSGSTSSLLALSKLGLPYCKSIILLNPAKPSDPRKRQILGDARVLKSILSVSKVTGAEQMPPLVCEFFTEKDRQLGLSILPGKVIALEPDYIMAKIMVQTSRSPGLGFVYAQLVGYEGVELYFIAVPPQAVGQRFGEVLWHYQKTTVMGVLLTDQTYLWNPSPDHLLRDGDHLIVLATDRESIHYYPHPVTTPGPFEFSGDRFRERVDAELIIGWSRKIEKLVDKYANYVIDGSQIDIIVAQITEKMRKQMAVIKQRFPYLGVHLLEDDIHEEGVLEKYHPENYDNVILVTEEVDDDTEELDSDTVSKLLELRNYFMKLEQETGIKVRTQLITEVMDSRNAEIIYNSGVRDFFIPDQFISKILVQVSQDPRVHTAYEQLFSAEGSEIYLKPVGMYFRNFPVKHRFAECVAAAQRRGELCLGVRIDSQRASLGDQFGIYLAPEKTQEFYFVREDKLIVLAEDMS